MRVEPIPEDMMELAQEYRTKLLDACADIDEEIMMLVLEEQPVPQDMIRKALRKGTIENLLVPVTCGTSYRNKGVQKLLDAIVDYMPSPVDIPAIQGVNPETDEEDERPASDEAPFSALAFKIATDPFVGRLSFIRVYSGMLNTGTTVLNSTKKQRERIGRILQMHANHREDIETVYSGDIAAVIGLKNSTTGDTLCDPAHPIILESMEFPDPVIRVAIEPKTKAGQEKMGIALAKLAEEDPHLQDLHRRGDWSDHHRRHGRAPSGDHRGPSAPGVQGGGQRGRAPGRLQGDHPARLWIRTPSMPASPAVRGQYGHVKIHVEPNESGKGYEFINNIVGGAIPKEYIPCGGRRYPGRHAGRCAGWLPGGGREGHPVRRLLPRGGLL